MIAITQVMDKVQVERQVRDWRKRISDLYVTIGDWTKQTEYSIKIGNKIMMYEELMARFNVDPMEINTADVYKDERIVLTFKPKGLWTIGANGRVDILSMRGSYVLLDTAEQFRNPKWKLYNGDKKSGVDFTKHSFLQLLNRIVHEEQ